MPTKRGSAKALIKVDGFGTEEIFLFSRKRAKGKSKHKRFELLGGGIEGTDPHEGLVRELDEEEKTGRLAAFARELQCHPHLVTVDGTPQYVFEFTIPISLYLETRHHRSESMGFVLVPRARLKDPGMPERFTSKTVGILHALDLM